MAPRPYWSGYLRLSLVSCPIFLTPATSERETIRLHQINPETGNRIRLQPIDAETEEPLDRADLVKGYEVEKGEYVILDKEELEALKIESSRVLDITEFVDAAGIDTLYFHTPYFVYPEGRSAEEAYRVIAEAIGRKKKVALGRVTFATREHPVALAPYENGLLLSTLLTQQEVREAAFDLPERVNEEMVDLAETIIDRMPGKWEPSKFHDRYQDALRELIASKSKGSKPKPAARRFEPQANVVDLMAVLKRSLAQTAERKGAPNAKQRKRPAKAPSKQRNMLLPVAGGRDAKPSAAAAAQRKPLRRKRA